MDQFVCVRIVQANAMNLAVFQFDFDLTFAVFFMNADQTIYGRFGSRASREDATRDITMEGFGEALKAALAVHQEYPHNGASLAGKRGPAPRFRAPEEYPSLRGRYLAHLNYDGNVVQSCMHCHQIRDAERLVYRTAGDPIPDDVLFPWPMPDVLGLSLAPKQRCAVVHVAAESSAARDGFLPGDHIQSLQGQPLVSIADVQWVLHTAPPRGNLDAQVLRDGRTLDLQITLEPGWRRRADISWRVSTWDLRRMGTGGLLLEDLSPEERRAQGVGDSTLALLVKHVGQYGEHAVAKRAGFQKGDVIAELDGRTDRMSETQFLAYMMQNTAAEDRVPITVLREGKRVQLILPLQ